MSILYKKNRAFKRIMRNKFRVPSPSAKQREHAVTTAAATVFPLSADIPENYNDTYVRAIPRDPQSTFVYWEMPKAKAEERGVPDAGRTHTNNDVAKAIERKVHDNKNCHSGNAVQQQHYSFHDNSWHWGAGDNNQQQQQRHDNDGRRDHHHQHHVNNNHNVNEDHRQHYTDSHNTDSHTVNRHQHDSGHYHTDTRQPYCIPSGFNPSAPVGSTYINTPAADRHNERRETILTPDASIPLQHISSGIFYNGKRQSS